MIKITSEGIKNEKKRQKRYSLAEKIQFIGFMINRENSDSSPSVSDYAERKGVSREILYNIEKEFSQKFCAKKPGRKKEKKKKLCKLSKLCGKDQEQIMRVILTAAVMPASASEIKKLVAEAFELTISKSTIKEIIRKYANKAKTVLEKSGAKEKVKNLAVDEIFSGNKPILTGVELNSFAVVISEKSEKRDNEAWKRALEGFPALELITSDQGAGIIKAVSEMDKIHHQFDLFHFKREACRVLRNLESQAYKKIDLEYKTSSKLKKCKNAPKCEILEILEKEYHDHCSEARKSIELFDQCYKAVGLIFEALEIFDSKGNFFDPAVSIIKLEIGADWLAKASTNRTIQNLAKRAKSENLKLFITQLHTKLSNISLEWNHTGVFTRKKVIEILAQHWFLSNQPQKSFSYKDDETYKQWMNRKQRALKNVEAKHLSVLLQLRQVQIAVKNFDQIQAKIFKALSEIHRASSLVESYNSQVRICQQVKKGLHHNFLYLSALKWNCSPFQSGKRKGKSPFQILGVHSKQVCWLDLLLAV